MARRDGRKLRTLKNMFSRKHLPPIDHKFIICLEV
jgi:hypothetical protein